MKIERVVGFRGLNLMIENVDRTRIENKTERGVMFFLYFKICPSRGRHVMGAYRVA